MGMIKNQKIKMGKISEFPPGKIIEKRILAKRIAVANLDGKFIGFESECKHMKASMAKGSIVDQTITCPWHGWKYDLNNGNCLTDDKFKLKRYEVEVIDDQVFLIMN